MPEGRARWPRLLAFAGPGYLVAVGYMDPGNWATDLSGGGGFGYTLLSVVLASNLMAMLLQALAARLGIATGQDLAEACRDAYSRPVNLALYGLCEAAIIACDLAEVIGTAIAFKLLFGLPLFWGALLTALDSVLVLLLMRRGVRALEAFVVALIVLTAGCFAVELVLASPSWSGVLSGFVPQPQIVRDPAALYIAIGIIGATVMPHNLYLHSSLVQSRGYARSEEGRREAIGWASWDSSLALLLAFAVNAAILILAAAAFHSGHRGVSGIEQAWRLLSPLLGFGAASTLFAVALLASGLNSAVTATLAGQIVMEGFLDLRLPHWLRRLLTRGIAIVPVLTITALYGGRGTDDLLVLSQVILSLQLPFAVVPLLRFVSDRRRMGRLAIGRKTALAAWTVAAVLIALDLKLVVDVLI